MTAMTLLPVIFILGGYSGCASLTQHIETTKNSNFNEEKESDYGNLLIVNETSGDIFLDNIMSEYCSYSVRYRYNNMSKDFYFFLPLDGSDITIGTSSFSLKIKSGKKMNLQFIKDNHFNKNFYKLENNEATKTNSLILLCQTDNIKYHLLCSKQPFSYNSYGKYVEAIKEYGLYSEGYEDENGSIVFIFTDDQQLEDSD